MPKKVLAMIFEKSRQEQESLSKLVFISSFGKMGYFFHQMTLD